MEASGKGTGSQRSSAGDPLETHHLEAGSEASDSTAPGITHSPVTGGNWAVGSGTCLGFWRPTPAWREQELGRRTPEETSCGDFTLPSKEVGGLHFDSTVITCPHQGNSGANQLGDL